MKVTLATLVILTLAVPSFADDEVKKNEWVWVPNGPSCNTFTQSVKLAKNIEITKSFIVSARRMKGCRVNPTSQLAAVSYITPYENSQVGFILVRFYFLKSKDVQYGWLHVTDREKNRYENIDI